MVVHRHGAEAALVFQQQLDRHLVALGRGDRVLEHVGAVRLPVHRDHGGAGAHAGLERRAVPAHVVDLAALGERQPDRPGEVEDVPRRFRAALVLLFIGAGLVGVDQLPAGSCQAAGQRGIQRVHARVQEARPVVLRHAVQRRHHVVEGIGPGDEAAVVDAEEGTGEIIQRFAPVREAANFCIHRQPHHLAAAVVLLAHLPAAVRQRRAQRSGGIVGGVLQRAPAEADPVAVVIGRDHRQRIAELLRRPQAGARGQHEAPVLGLALVHPQQRIAHRHVEVRRPQIRRTAELSVPRMGVLVRQQVAVGRGVGPGGEVVRVQAVLAGLVVLGAVAGQHVRQREQEVVVVVVLRAEQLHRLGHQRAVRLQLLRGDLQVLRRIRDDVQVHRHLAVRGKVHALEITPRVDRRIHQRVEGHRLERDGVALARRGFQRGAELPARRQREAGRDRDAAGVVPGRIQRDLAPRHVHHAVGDLEAAAARRQVLELHVQAGHACGHVEVERVDVVLVALPRHRLAVGAELQSGQHVDRAGGRVVAGNPLRIQQGQRTGRDRNRLLHAEDALRRVAGIDMQRDRAGVRRVLRVRHLQAALLLRQRGAGKQRQRSRQHASAGQPAHGRRAGGRTSGHGRLRDAAGSASN